MFSVFLELVKRVGIFVIIGQTILHFGISKKFEKYMKLVISFMVAAQIVFAFGVYLKRDGSSWQIMSAEEYLKEWDTNMEELEDMIEECKEDMEQSMNEKFQQSEKNMIKNDGQENNQIRIEKIIIQ